jgi:exosortase C (VPDSG-CTERM-specific)
MMLALLALFLSAAFFCLGPETMRRATFPLTLLLFIIPFPDPLLQAIVSFLQHRSADVAAGLFSLSGMPFLRRDTFFRIPGMLLEVAPECSGIRSTLVLFITSLVAGYLFLRSPWRRAALAIAVVPLALLRNGFRVFAIGELCVHVGPEMIHSPIHKRGGPLFFALSLIPFFLLLLWLRRNDRLGLPLASAAVSSH